MELGNESITDANRVARQPHSRTRRTANLHVTEKGGNRDKNFEGYLRPCIGDSGVKRFTNSKGGPVETVVKHLPKTLKEYWLKLLLLQNESSISLSENRKPRTISSTFYHAAGHVRIEDRRLQERSREQFTHILRRA
jgi:hypothetical protein